MECTVDDDPWSVEYSNQFTKVPISDALFFVSFYRVSDILSQNLTLTLGGQIDGHV